MKGESTMRKGYKNIKSAPFEYVTPDGVIMKQTLVPIQGVKISNSFDISYVRGIVGFFNAMISRFMYFAIYDEKGNERRYPVAQNHIYLPADQLSKMINKCESQCYNIKNQMERLFDLDITRSSANRFRLSERVNEFLYIFNEKQLYEFIEKYNITDSADRYRLRQLYHYRIVRPSDNNMTDPNIRRDFFSFMKERKHKNFNHHVQRNNETNQVRIQKIELHIDLLSDKQKEQLQRIKDRIKESTTKLVYRFYWKLIELQQFITGMLLKDQVMASNSNREEEQPHSQVIDRNKTEGEMQKTHEVAAKHLKDPEEHGYHEIVQIQVCWNIMARGRKMEFINSLTDKRIKSIETLVKYHGKAKVLDTIQNTGNLMLNSTLMWESFTKNSNDPDSRFNKIHRHVNPHSELTEAEKITRSNKRFKFWTNHSLISHDRIEELDFNSKAKAKSWFKSMLNEM